MYQAKKIEEEILKYWDEHRCFEKSVASRPESKPYVFYDGPPFATGLPHYGHIVASLMKDVVPRFWTMRGFKVERVWGWDCHGLPIENIIEDKLNLKSKQDIERFGVEKFNEECRSAVLTYAEDWKKTIRRMGRWVDMENAYKTMDLSYMESVWWVFKQLWDKGLIYQGRKAMHICPRCVTPLSNFEVTQNYKEVEDLTVIVKFQITNCKSQINSKLQIPNDKPMYLLAWTTTPWTLAGNTLLAVNPEIDYILVRATKKGAFSGSFLGFESPAVKKGLPSINNGIITVNNVKGNLSTDENLKRVDKWTQGESNPSRMDGNSFSAARSGPNLSDPQEILYQEIIIIAKDRVAILNKDSVQLEILQKIKGSDLVSLRYEPLFPYFAETPNAFRVVAGDFVSTEEGTGIVHIAPAFGEDDYHLGQREKVPLVQHVTMEGKFVPDVKDFAGWEVKPKEEPTKTDAAMVAWLDKQGKIFSQEKVVHSYPHCWRCETPLLNYATSSWFVKVSDLKKQLIKNNKDINWVPEHMKEGRFGEWLKGARDWAISRNRYWGTPLPVWESKDGKQLCVGSVKELAKLSNEKMTKIIFVRHGESEMNIKRIKSSEFDKYPLTKKGIDEVKNIACQIKDEVDLIISSPVLRAKQTAEILSKELGVKIIFDELITEYFYGSWEGKSVEELLETEEYRQYKKLPFGKKFGYKLGRDGESRKEIAERVRKFINKIVAAYPGQTILVASHGGINAATSLILRDISFETYFAEERIGYAGAQYFYIKEGGKEFNLHKHIVDKIEIKKDDKIYHRVPEVLDCWFESGSMPYAQFHYPFENKKKFEIGFPAEFIAEGQDQTRGWFYTMHVLATALTSGKNPAIPVKKSCSSFKNVIVNGIVLAEDGKKMSKRLKNYPEPELILEKYGADAMRYYLLTSPVMEAENLNFFEAGVREMYNKVVNTLWNVVEFYKLYSYELKTNKKRIGTNNVLDKWIAARLNQLIKEVTEGMEEYQLVKASRPMADFIADLSQWWLRRSRARFKSDVVEEKNQALNTLFYILNTLSKLLAPFTPFIAEKIYQEITTSLHHDITTSQKESVHLEEWPVANEKLIDKKVLEQMDLARKIVEMGLAIRAEKGIRVRQPLNRLQVIGYRLQGEFLQIIADELNVKEIAEISEIRKLGNWEIKEDGGLKVALNIEITPELKKEGLAREIIRAINQMRKDKGLTIKDRVAITYQTEDGILKEILVEFGGEIKKNVLADKLEEGEGEKELEVDGRKVILKIHNS